MTGRYNNRRIVDRDREGERDAVFRQDLDQRFLVLKNGRITLSLDALRDALGIEAIAAQAAAGVTIEPAAPEVAVFEGAGADGLVPDPGTETGLFLKDDGTWAAPAGGGGGAPTGAAYVTVGNDGTLTAERALTGSGRISVTDGGANGAVTLDIPDGGVSRAKLADGSGNSVIGRASNTIGPVADIVAVTTGHVLRQSGSVLGFGKIGTSSIDTDAVDNTQLANMLTDRIKGRVTSGTGDPEDLTAAQVRTLLNVADGANAYTHPNHSGDVTSVGDGAQTIAAGVVSNSKLANMANGTYKARITAGAGAPEDIPLAGTAFPTSPAPVDGQMFYRTDHRTAYVYNATTSVWLSIQIHEVPYGQTSATASNAFFKVNGSNGSALFSANYGYVFGFNVAVVGISWRSVSAPVSAGTATIAVFADNVAVASATMNVTGSDLTKTREDFLPAAGVSAGQILQVKNTGSATSATAAMGYIRLRRRET